MKALRKDTIREIRKSFSRFLSIVAIVALGISFFSGVRSASPSMIRTADDYFKDQKLMDIHLISTYGFQEEDLQAIAETEGAAAVSAGYTADVIAENGSKRSVIRTYSLPGEGDLNQPLLVEGRMPEKENECVVEVPDVSIPGVENNYEIGKTVKLLPEIGDELLSDTLSVSEFTIVGYVRSPLYISIERGTTTVGSGDIALYMYLKPDVYKAERYTDVWVYSEASAEGAEAFSDTYDQAVSTLKQNLEATGEACLSRNYEEMRREGTQELDKARRELKEAQDTFNREIADAEAEIAANEATLTTGEQELSEGQKTFETEIGNAEATLNAKEAELAQGEASLASGREKYEQGMAAWQQGKADFDRQKEEAQAQIDTGKAALSEMDAGIQTLQQQIDSLTALLPEQPELEAQIAQLETQKKALEDQYAEVSAQLTEAENSLTQGQQTLDASKAELDQTKEVLDKSEQQLAEGRTALSEGWQTLNQQRGEGQRQLEESAAALAEGRQQLEEGKATLEAQKAEGQVQLDDAQKEIDDGQKALDELDFGKWYVQTREDNPGYSSYGEDTKRISNVADIFPVFFLLVAALVSFTTMTRMVEEQRMEIGTLKAMGYSYWAIASKYIIYAALAAFIGCFIGVAVGVNTLPRFIVTAYNLLYQVPGFQLSIPMVPVVVSCSIALFCTVGAAIIIVTTELREEPSELMRPKAPKIGKRIILERIPFLWNRMGFISKVTARNILRYKARFFMTVIGISGCTALILSGFGIHDSIFSIIPKQFNEISVYDSMMALKHEGTADALGATKAAIAADEDVSEVMLGRMLRMDVTKEGGSGSKEAYLIVPESTENFDDYIVLKERTGDQNRIELSEQGAVITEKMSRDLDIQAGDTISLSSDDETYCFTVSDVTENYIENYVYISPSLYEQVTGKAAEYNVVFANLVNTDSEATQAFSERWLDSDTVLSINFTETIRDSSLDSLNSLNLVVVIMLVSAGALAFVVLYNLTNINVSERVREIATIRVLGFYDREVNNYIYRENIVLSLFGMVIGLFLGIGLNNFIITTVETDIVMFGRGIEWTSFLWAGCFTMLFTLIVNFFMAPVIRKVDMVESLKSIE